MLAVPARARNNFTGTPASTARAAGEGAYARTMFTMRLAGALQSITRSSLRSGLVMLGLPLC